MRRALIVALSISVAAAAAVGLALVFQRQLIYLPSGDPGGPPIGAEAVSFTTADGLTLEGWFFPFESSGAPTAVVFSGNAGNRSGRTPLARALGDLGFGVLVFDYRGYGGNPGRPTEEGLVADGRAAIDYTLGRSDVDPAKLVYFGESLGTGVAVASAVDRNPALLILRSPFTSLPDVAATVPVLGRLSGMLWDEFPTLDRMPRIDTPVLVVAGSTDQTIPIDQSRRVFDAAAGPKLFHEVEADHNEPALAWGFLSDTAVVDFIETSISGSGS